MTVASAFRAAAVALPLCVLLFGLQGCKSNSGGAYSDEQVKQMNAVAAGAKDPSQQSPELVKQREAATAALRATTASTPPPGPPPGAPAAK